MAFIDKNWGYKRRRPKRLEVPSHPHFHYRAHGHLDEVGPYMSLTFRDEGTLTDGGEVKTLDLELSLEEVEYLVKEYQAAMAPGGVWATNIERQATIERPEASDADQAEAELMRLIDSYG